MEKDASPAGSPPRRGPLQLRRIPGEAPVVLGDDDITARINAAHLILPFEPRNIENGNYTLRAGEFIEPESGELIDFAAAGGRRRLGCKIGPTEVMLVMTMEKVKIPADLCAIYAPLNRLSRKGLMLINASLIEPGYEGHLSCLLINTGSKSVFIKPEEEISKVMFLQLTPSAGAPKAKTIGGDEYKRELAGSALNFKTSFLDVSGIEDRAAQKAKDEVKNSVRFAAFVIAILVTFGTIEPLLSKFIYDRAGIATVSQRTADALLLKDSQTTRDELKALRDGMEAQKRVETELERLRTKVDQLESARSRQEPPSGKPDATVTSPTAPKS